MTRTAAIAAASAAALALAVGAAFALRPLLFPPGDPFADCRSMAVVGGTEGLGTDFTLVSETGATVTRDEVVDRLTLLYFGYTYCPDVCPADTARNAEAAELLAARGIALRPVLVSVDPARDTPEALRDYTDLLHPDMLGLTGDEATVRSVARAFGAYAAKQGTGEDYLVNHSTYSYLMAPGRGVLDVIRRERTAAEVADTVACFAARL